MILNSYTVGSLCLTSDYEYYVIQESARLLSKFPSMFPSVFVESLETYEAISSFIACRWFALFPFGPASHSAGLDCQVRNFGLFWERDNNPS